MRMFIYSLDSFSLVTGGRYRIILETTSTKEAEEDEKKKGIYYTLCAFVLKELSVDTYEETETGKNKNPK